MDAFKKWQLSFDDKKRYGTIAKIVLMLFKVYIVLCLSFVILYPILYMLSQGLRSFEDMYDPSVVWIPKHYSFKSFVIAFERMDYIKTASSTAYISLVSTLLQLVSCSLAGYGFARFNFKFKNLFFGLCLFSIVVPTQMIMIPTFMQIKYFNVLGIGSIARLFTGAYPDLYNTPYSLFVPALLANGIRGSMYIFIFRQFFRGIPKDLEDAAYIDGAGYIKSYLRIIIPAAKAPFLVVFILSTIWYWSDATITSFFYNSGNLIASKLLSLLSYAVSNSYDVSYTLREVLAFQLAGCILMILPPLTMFLVLQRNFIESIDKTGLK